jgi:four helix bundle protein
VPKNIAEGLGRESLKEQFQFLGIAYASLMEFISLLVTIEKIGLAEKHVIDKLLNNSEKVAQLINGYRRYLI